MTAADHTTDASHKAYRQARDQLRLAIRSLARAQANLARAELHTEAGELYSRLSGLQEQLDRLTPASTKQRHTRPGQAPEKKRRSL